MTIAVGIAEELMQCQRCGGTIPIGDRYWYTKRNIEEDQSVDTEPSDNLPVEHTNCLLYGKDAHKYTL